MVIWKVQEGLKYDEHTHTHEREKENEVTGDLHRSSSSESEKYSLISNRYDELTY